jgi:hypothetical protein
VRPIRSARLRAPRPRPRARPFEDHGAIPFDHAPASIAGACAVIVT